MQGHECCQECTAWCCVANCGCQKAHRASLQSSEQPNCPYTHTLPAEYLCHPTPKAPAFPMSHLQHIAHCTHLSCVAGSVPRTLQTWPAAPQESRVLPDAGGGVPADACCCCRYCRPAAGTQQHHVAGTTAAGQHESTVGPQRADTSVGVVGSSTLCLLGPGLPSRHPEPT